MLHQGWDVPCAVDNGDDVERFGVAQVEHHVGRGMVDVDRPGEQVVAKMADAWVSGKAIECGIQALLDVHAARLAGVFGDLVEESGKVLLSVGCELISGRHA